MTEEKINGLDPSRMKTRFAGLALGVLDIIIGSVITLLWWDQRRKESRRDRK